MVIPYAEVIGDPIGHSKSPIIHNYWLRQLGVEGEYRGTLVAAHELADFVEERRRVSNWRGCNVTMPHKQSIIPLLDSLSSEAEQIGAVNAVLRGTDGRLQGRNTDVSGVFGCLGRMQLEGRTALLIGAGGAARAAAFALSCTGAKVHVMNRSVDKARQLLLDFNLSGDVLPLGQFPPADVLINASALGMPGNPWPFLDLQELPPESVVMDMVYAPRDTPLLIEAEKLGLKTISGLDMLVQQAREAFSMFFGEAPPEGDDPGLRELLER